MVSVDGAMPRKDVKIYYFNLRKEAKEGKFLQEDQAKDSKEKEVVVMTASSNKIHGKAPEEVTRSPEPGSWRPAPPRAARHGGAALTGMPWSEEKSLFWL
ncbi:unnamed protein product [Durusdinium trenchii]|uniref:Uncharacterized protein n=1 Tax=Durusdinium trenchii TaxID=1381693 RepID=A0ABP0JKP1_9DINO